MSEHVFEVEQESTSLGKVEIAPEVIEVIAGIAASEVEGVAQMRGNFAAGVVERFGKKNHGKGVKVDLREEGVAIDIYCLIQFGVSIPSVAKKIQENVRQALFNMTGLETSEINVHVVGIQFDTPKQEQEIE
ncbi:putative alkaline shock family protein YloU [Anoxybacillus tepidamans]|uniref:Putative alkaline shock family protein YloU n=1 Tax=Anoxybacteroides tepidamans TaxID=265948 RepID=A0A7W8ISR1_9BACL|nr:Asp23/Gls24 family envelope stress response protein [Anoxybacillus tepidamans]MBB5325261.1 putative alkaline shock family protein YloU [Anoxybacillus tepidamans]